MTARQLAILKNHQTQFLTSSGGFPGYSGMTRLLNRMADDEEIIITQLKKGKRVLVNLPQICHLPTINAPSIHGWAHELHSADIYVALTCAGILKYWFYGPFDDMPDTIEPDRGFVVGAVPIFLEADEDSEGLPEIRSKAERYAQFARSSGRKFYVLFSCSTKERAKKTYTEVLYQYRGGQFLSVFKEDLLRDPTGAVLASPKDYRRGFSLLELM